MHAPCPCPVRNPGPAQVGSLPNFGGSDTFKCEDHRPEGIPFWNSVVILPGLSLP